MEKTLRLSGVTRKSIWFYSFTPTTNSLFLSVPKNVIASETEYDNLNVYPRAWVTQCQKLEWSCTMQTVWPPAAGLEKEAVLPKHETKKTAFYKGFCQVPFLFILPFVTVNQKSEYENSFLLFLLYFPFLIKNCPCFAGGLKKICKQIKLITSR